MFAFLHRAWHRWFPPKLSVEEKEYLSRYSSYYQHLNPFEKVRFEHRLAVINRWLEYIPHRIDQVTPEMKVVVGSGIAQVSFGLRRYLFRNFRKINLVPDVYTYPGMENTRFIGDTNRNNWVISLSWPHVLDGFQRPDDGHNVVLHEIAHGLEWEHLIGRRKIQAFLRHDDYRMWQRLAAKKLYVIRKGENTFLKNYGGTNLGELFAVSVEAFFEQPQDYKKRLPHLYRQMCLLLNQDPANRADPVLIAKGV